MKFIKILGDTLRGLEEAADISREAKLLDDESVEDLAQAGSAIYRILIRLRTKGLIDPAEAEELRRSEEESLRKLLEKP